MTSTTDITLDYARHVEKTGEDPENYFPVPTTKTRQAWLRLREVETGRYQWLNWRVPGGKWRPPSEAFIELMELAYSAARTDDGAGRYLVKKDDLPLVQFPEPNKRDGTWRALVAVTVPLPERTIKESRQRAAWRYLNGKE